METENPNKEEATPVNTGTTATNMDEVKVFYKDSFPKIFKAVFMEPIKGTYDLFSSRSEKAYQHSIFLILTAGILFTLLPYIAAGDARSYMEFKYFLMMGVTAILCLLVISLLSFGIKSVSGKADIKNELLTGGLCSIPLSVLIVAAFVLSLFSKDLMQNIMNPQALLSGSFVVVLLVFYVILSMINIFQQSLKSSGTNDAVAWYLSPISILLAIYVTGKIVFEVLK